MGFDHGAGGATGTAGAGGATGTAPRLRLGILGTGYLGATHAVCMSELGFDVLGMDVDDGKIAKLAAGEAPFYEPGLEPLLRKGLDSGRLRFTTSYAEVAAFADVHFLCVGTPQKDGEYAADLSAVDAAVDGLLPLLSRPCLLVGQSTVPAGTADRLAARVAAEAPTVELVGVSFGGMKVAGHGAAFKPNSDDIRDSPALDVAATIQRRGAAVAIYDPMAMEQARVKYPQLGYRDCALSAVKGADLVLHLTEWPEFREADPAALGEVVAERRIVDGRNALDASRWRAAGWVYRALGRP